MNRAIVANHPGGIDMLEWKEWPLPTLKGGEVLLRQTAVGVNFIDIYHRTGLYPLRHYPGVIGVEAAGIVEECGPGVQSVQPGDRVAYALGEVGAYSEYRQIPERRLIKLPGNVSDDQAAASLIKGLTAHYLLFDTYKVKEGDTILVHAAAGGVGLLLCQWASRIGATIIGTVSTAEKAELAKSNGCTHTILYNEQDVSEVTKEITRGRGVDVVYDSVGRTTFDASLDCLRPLGMMVCYGQASGKIPPIDIGILAAKGSLFLTRPTLANYIADRETYEMRANALFEGIANRWLNVRIDSTLPLSEAKKAHELLESRATKGAIILKP